MQATMEKQLTEAKKTVDKLRGKLDDMMCDAVKNGKSVAVMVQKSQLKEKEKQLKFSHSDAVIDRAIAKKGRG